MRTDESSGLYRKGIPIVSVLPARRRCQITYLQPPLAAIYQLWAGRHEFQCLRASRSPKSVWQIALRQISGVGATNALAGKTRRLKTVLTLFANQADRPLATGFRSPIQLPPGVTGATGRLNWTAGNPSPLSRRHRQAGRTMSGFSLQPCSAHQNGPATLVESVVATSRKIRELRSTPRERTGRWSAVNNALICLPLLRKLRGDLSRRRANARCSNCQYLASEAGKTFSTPLPKCAKRSIFHSLPADDLHETHRPLWPAASVRGMPPPLPHSAVQCWQNRQNRTPPRRDRHFAGSGKPV